MPETIENRIFEKFKQDLTTYYYIELLIDQQDSREKLYSGAVATFTGGGTLFAFTNLFDHTIVYTIITFITSFIAALVVIFNKFSSIYIKSPDEIRKLTELHQKLYLQAEQVQPILRRLRSEEIKPSLAEDQFSKFLEKNVKNNTEASRLIGKINNKLSDKAKDRADTYIKAVYY